MQQWSIEQLRAEAVLARSLADRNEMLINAIQQLTAMQREAGKADSPEISARPAEE